MGVAERTVREFQQAERVEVFSFTLGIPKGRQEYWKSLLAKGRRKPGMLVRTSPTSLPRKPKTT